MSSNGGNQVTVALDETDETGFSRSPPTRDSVRQAHPLLTLPNGEDSNPSSRSQTPSKRMDLHHDTVESAKLERQQSLRGNITLAWHDLQVDLDVPQGCISRLRGEPPPENKPILKRGKWNMVPSQ